MLQIRDLVKIYPGPVAALKGVSLDIPPGLFGLLGPNGAGKSTLMNILAGLLEPTGGSVTLDGQNTLADPRVIWRVLGYLPQDFGFYPSLTGTQMLDFLLRLKGIEGGSGRRALVKELLERVNLAEAANRKVRTYSGGMKQRLGIAQAIAGNPRVVIVDEPTAGLDPEERQRFYRILAELGRDRIVLLSTHIVEDVATLCPRFAVIRGGRCVATGGTAQARTQLEGRVFEGVVEGVSAGIYQVDGETTGYGLARVSQTLDWMRLAQRFPVRVTFLEQPDGVPLRSGANAEVTVDADLARDAAAVQADVLP